MIRSTIVIATLAGAILLPSGVAAQAQRNVREAVQDQHQIVVDKKKLERDRAEVENFGSLLTELRAATPGEPATYESLSAQLRDAMRREKEQATARLGQAGREVRQSRRELRGERQEATATGAVHDKVQQVDDRRDLRDDRIDRTAAHSRMQRMESIIAKSEALQPAIAQGHEEAMVKNSRLMGEFLELMRAELRATASELVEDRGERREDRRERLTDRRN